MDAAPDQPAKGLPITEDDLKKYWRRIGKPSNCFPRIHRKNNVSLIHMANVYVGSRTEVLGTAPAADAYYCWTKFQEKLGYKEKQMQDVFSITMDPKIKFEEFLKECIAGEVCTKREEMQGKKRKREDLAREPVGPLDPGALPLVKKKRSKASKHTATQQSAECAQRGATEGQGRSFAAAEEGAHANPSGQGTPEGNEAGRANTGPSKTPKPLKTPVRSPLAAPVSPRAPCVGSPRSPCAPSVLRRSPRTALFETVQKDSSDEGHESAARAAKTTNKSPDSERGARPTNGHGIPAVAAASRPFGGSNVSQEKSDVGAHSPALRGEPQAATARPAPERWTSPRRRPTETGRASRSSSPARPEGTARTTSTSSAAFEVRRSPRTMVPPGTGTTTGPSNEPGSPLAQRPKKVAPKERPCPSNTEPPCPGLVPSAANKCKTCGFDIKDLRQRPQQEKLERKVSALKDTKGIIRRVKDDLKLLSQKGVETSLIWYEGSADEPSLRKEGKKGVVKGPEVHFLGFGELGDSWVSSDDVQKSYKKALRVFRKAKRDHNEKVANEKTTTGREDNGAGSSERPSAAAPSESVKHVLSETLLGIIESLKFEETLKAKLISNLEKGEVTEAGSSSLKILIDDKDCLNLIFGEKAGPRTLLKVAVKKWAEAESQKR